MIEIDGAMISGGGQIIRTALALSAYTEKPFRIKNIRAKRPQPGLKPQHLEAVRTMAHLCDAEVRGAYKGSQELEFKPKEFTARDMDMHIGTAGAITLLVQAICLPAMNDKKATYTVHGGTDVRWSPPIDYLRYVVAPILEHFGHFEIKIDRRGYYPSGGGKVTFIIGKKNDVKPIALIERGLLEEIEVYTTASQKLLDKSICEDVQRNIQVYFDNIGARVSVRNAYVNTIDPGWGVFAGARYNLGKSRILLGVDVLGDEVSGSQEAASIVSRDLKELMKSDGCVDEHLADHLIPFLAVHGGELSTTRISSHVKANIAVCELFLDVKFRINNNHITVSRLMK